MNSKEQEAYDWALNQNYPSVAARYAKTLALYIRRLEEADAETDRNSRICPNDDAPLVPGEFSGMVCPVCGYRWSND